jgi:tetratricopeptide (TPR) repeat protein
LAGEPEGNPIFYFGRAYQGAKGPVYPYPFLDVLTDVRVDMAYKGLLLENEYLKICVLPEIGGRIFEAVDKTNGYNFFYRQHVIKPALIGMLGAWISGGVEWNIPHHHRATSFLPVDWALTEGADGSKTVWVGETELRHRVRWIVGLTLRPGSSALEVSYRIINRTPFAHSILCWANAAVHVNEDYQVIFPPSTTLAAFHGKNQFSRWPVSREVYNGVDYTRGVDVSWWKNHPRPTSFFAFESEGDFLAGYDHGRDAGVIFVGRHQDVPGKKFWTWGTGSEGRLWEKILTDSDGPYLELMFGSFSDNQPDYSWVHPYEVKAFRQYWYPVRGLRGVKNATVAAACQLDIRDGQRAFVGFHSTSRHERANAVVKAGEKTLLARTIEISPEQPFTEEIPLPPGTGEESLGIFLLTAEGRELVSYRPARRTEPPLPEPVSPPPAVGEIPTNEELYLAGQRLEQFHNPALEPDPYYKEVLRRDPEDSRANTALGRRHLMRGENQKAEAKLRRAVARISKNFTRPKDGEPLYYLGLSLQAQGKERDAESAFARAAWSSAWSAAANYHLAEMAAGRGELHLALEYADRSLDTNALNPKARCLRAGLFRKMSLLQEAERAARECLSEDPLDFWAANELILTAFARGLSAEADRALADLGAMMRGAVQNHLELAVDYGRCGWYEEAVGVLSRLAGEKRGDSPHPMLYYYLALYAHHLGKEREAYEYLDKASRLPAKYCFPFRLESIPALRWAEAENPSDARAPHYLGNLLFDLRPDEAIEEWERSRTLDESSAAVHRNLGIGYARARRDLGAAVASLEKAIARDPADARLFLEWNQLADLAGLAPAARLEMLEKHHEVVAERDDSLSAEIALLVELGRYDRAIELLRGHHFRVWEGGEGTHGIYVDAHLGRGRKHLAEKEPARALKDFETALKYPDHLEAARPLGGGRAPEVFFLIGMALRALGESGAARSAFEKSVSEPAGLSESAYFQGLSWQQLGRRKEAAAVFDRLISSARENLERSPALDYFAKFGEKESDERKRAHSHYLLGLGLRGNGREKEARAEFRKALEYYPHFSRARRELADSSPDE